RTVLSPTPPPRCPGRWVAPRRERGSAPSGGGRREAPDRAGAEVRSGSAVFGRARRYRTLCANPPVAASVSETMRVPQVQRLGVFVRLVPRVGVATPAGAQCVDGELEEQLIGRRAYRGVVPRVFKKALRHELSAFGGWYAADLSDGRPTFGGAYTFHFTEEL